MKDRPRADGRTEVEALNRRDKRDKSRSGWRLRSDAVRPHSVRRGKYAVRVNVKSLIGEGKKQIVLDMQNIDSIDGWGHWSPHI